MRRVLLVVGTRAEAIKMAPLSTMLKTSELFEAKLCVTAQHRQMLDQVLSLFDLTPDYDLDLMKPQQDLFDITSSVLAGLRGILSDFCPDLVLVHGDTTTTFAATLAAFYQKIPVGHVEAGLRTGDMYAPWPEEANRKLTTALATYHFSPTRQAADNLLAENVKPQQIVVTGNTVIDALFHVLGRIKADETLGTRLIKYIDTAMGRGFSVEADKIVLITGHRRENFGDGFVSICGAIRDLAARFPDWRFVYPVHLNPNVQRPVKDILSGLPNVFLTGPMVYEPFVYLMSRSRIILTDSGGVQEEAPSLGKPVLVMRETTERPEALSARTVRLVGTGRDRIVQAVADLIEDPELYKSMAIVHNPYGDGLASRRIVDFLVRNM